MSDVTLLQSRAVTRLIEPGNAASCAHCGEPVKFMARVQGRQVIANVYDGGKWQRVEHFHSACYSDLGDPYGEAPEPPKKTARRAS